ncbi:LysE family translocator [Gymnodinialimonas hymeniacidonis]|uniref:LysE family translocator n=1 Tax=Gymnodinialimonas hymeniacidonis TaxID=3126508 RepID=UPI0034C65CBC
MDWASLFSIFLAFFVVAVSPGPATLAVSTVSASHGRAAGAQFGIGLGFGLAFWGIVAATGLGAVLQTTTQLLLAIKIGGGCYLLWLAYSSARAAMRPNTTLVEERGSLPSGRWLLRGLTLNLSNPKAVVAWMAALAVGLRPDDGLAAVAVATCGCAMIGFAIYAAYAALFSLGPIRQVYAQFRRWIDGVVAGLFAIAGLALIRSAFQRGATSP